MSTLDEHCHPTLTAKSLKRRNEDQTITRHVYSPKKDQPILMVSQAWLWSNRDLLIATDLGKPQIKSDHIYDSFDGVDEVLVNIRQKGVNDVFVSVAILFAYLVDNLECEVSATESILDRYARATVTVAEDVDQYVKRSGVESMGIEKEKNFLHDINDIREELTMIRRVLIQQEEVWGDFASEIWPQIWAKSQEGRKPYLIDGSEPIITAKERALMNIVLRPNLLLQKFQRRISQLDEDADRVERSVITQLDVKAKHASLRESHVTAVMSAAVFGLTVITIIFTPLSFVMSLFALPIQSFQQRQIPSVWADDAGMYTANYIGKWTGKTTQC